MKIPPIVNSLSGLFNGTTLTPSAKNSEETVNALSQRKGNLVSKYHPPSNGVSFVNGYGKRNVMINEDLRKRNLPFAESYANETFVTKMSTNKLVMRTQKSQLSTRHTPSSKAYDHPFVENETMTTHQTPSREMICARPVSTEDSLCDHAAQIHSAPVAPPPRGYFTREDLSNEELALDQDAVFSRINEDILPCRFGHQVWARCNDFGDHSPEAACRDLMSNKKVVCCVESAPERRRNKIKKNVRSGERKGKRKYRKVKKSHQVNKAVKHRSNCSYQVTPSVMNYAKENNIVQSSNVVKKSPNKKKYNAFVNTNTSPAYGQFAFSHNEPKMEPKSSAKRITKNACLGRDNHNGNSNMQLLNSARKCNVHRSETLHLNTNVNASTSDIEDPESKHAGGVGGEAVYNFKNDTTVTGANLGSENFTFSESVGKHSSVNNADNYELSPGQCLGATKEHHALDAVINSFVQDVVREKVENERPLTKLNPEEPKMDGKSTKNAPVVIKFDCGFIKLESKKQKEGRIVHSQERLDKIAQKAPEKVNDVMTGSLSNIPSTVKNSRPLSGKHNLSQSVLESPVKSSRCKLPSYASSESTKASHPGNETVFSATNSIASKGHGSAGEEITQRRGRPNKSSGKTTEASILRKSNSTPGSEKGMQPPQAEKAKRKMKSVSPAKKSLSMSPISVRRSQQRGSSGSRQSSRQGPVVGKEACDQASKRTPSVKGRKKKKKVRIIVDSNGSPVKGTRHDQEDDGQREDFDDSENEVDGVGDTSAEHKREGEDDDSQEGDEFDDIMVSPICGPVHSDNSELAYSGLSPTHSGHGIKKNGSKKGVKTKKGTKNSVVKKKTKAEQGWDNNFICQKETSKTKAAPTKKKRYQLVKANDKPGTADSKPDDNDNEQIEIYESLDPEKKDTDLGSKNMSSYVGKKESSVKGISPVNYRFHKSDFMRKKSLDPSQMKGLEEGSSVDAPGFVCGGKRDNFLRVTKSGPAVCVGKRATADNMNTPQGRAKAAREQFGRVGGRKTGPQSSPYRYSPSPKSIGSLSVEQTDAAASRSTDLDIASGFKRQQTSPMRAIGASRPTRRDKDTKTSCQMKARSKSESDELRQRMASPREVKSDRRLGEYSDSMDVNVLNLGLSWMVQGLINRLPFFTPQSETDPPMYLPPSVASEQQEAQL